MQHQLFLVFLPIQKIYQIHPLHNLFSYLVQKQLNGSQKEGYVQPQTIVQVIYMPMPKYWMCMCFAGIAQVGLPVLPGNTGTDVNVDGTT